MEEIEVYEEKNYVHLFSGRLYSTYSILRLAHEIQKGKDKKDTLIRYSWIMGTSL
jgi:hypothetical protein